MIFIRNGCALIIVIASAICLSERHPIQRLDILSGIANPIINALRCADSPKRENL
jgi:hypothetical protein